MANVLEILAYILEMLSTHLRNKLESSSDPRIQSQPLKLQNLNLLIKRLRDTTFAPESPSAEAATSGAEVQGGSAPALLSGPQGYSRESLKKLAENAARVWNEFMGANPDMKTVLIEEIHSALQQILQITNETLFPCNPSSTSHVSMANAGVGASCGLGLNPVPHTKNVSRVTQPESSSCGDLGKKFSIIPDINFFENLNNPYLGPWSKYLAFFVYSDNIYDHIKPMLVNATFYSFLKGWSLLAFGQMRYKDVVKISSHIEKYGQTLLTQGAIEKVVIKTPRGLSVIQSALKDYFLLHTEAVYASDC